MIIIGLYAVLWGKSKEMKLEDDNMEKPTTEKPNGNHNIDEKDDMELQITHIK